MNRKNLLYILIAISSFMFLTPTLHEFGHVLVLIIYNLEIVEIHLEPNIFGNSYVLFVYEELTIVQFFFIWSGGFNLLLMIGILGIFIKNNVVRILSIVCLLDNIIYGFLGTMGNYGDLLVISYIIGSFTSILIYVILPIIIISIIITDHFYDIIPIEITIKSGLKDY